MENLTTWDVLLTFDGLVATTYLVTEFIKEIPLIRLLPTRYLSYLIALTFLFAVNIVMGLYEQTNILLYLVNAITISLSANGLKDFNRKKADDKNDKEI